MAVEPVQSAVIGLWNIAEADPQRIALVDCQEQQLSYGQLTGLANKYSRGLQKLGLGTGDAVVLMMPNGADFLAVYFAAMQIGLYVVAVNWHLTGTEVAYILNDSEAKAFITDQEFAETAASAVAVSGLDAHRCFSSGIAPGFGKLADLGNAQDLTRPDDRTTGGAMLYTSGTTGKPKGVRRPLTGANPDIVPDASTWFFSIFGLAPHDDHVHICGSPMYHTAVLNFVAISLQLGHQVVLMDKWDPEQMLRLMDKYRVTHSHMVPTQFHRLLALPEEVKERYSLASLRTMIHGAAPCPQQTKRHMLDWWGPVVTEYYAATEGGGTVISAKEWLEKPGSVGLSWPGSIVKVLDAEGKELPVGEPGQVYMKMGTSNFEYYRDEKKTQSSRLGQLFTLGDIGYLDADGYLFLCDRKSDMIISGGVNIYPAEIESELAVHPKVADVAVFGVPHQDWGEEIKAVVQPMEGIVGSPALTEELMKYASTRLAKFKLPKSIDYVMELPRDPNGKLYKRRLRDPYWEGRDHAI
ncbi:MAG: acyl-CoA synthetase [Mycobacteriaceae bacterium]